MSIHKLKPGFENCTHIGVILSTDKEYEIERLLCDIRLDSFIQLVEHVCDKNEEHRVIGLCSCEKGNKNTNDYYFNAKKVKEKLDIALVPIAFKWLYQEIVEYDNYYWDIIDALKITNKTIDLSI